MDLFLLIVFVIAVVLFIALRGRRHRRGASSTDGGVWISTSGGDGRADADGGGSGDSGDSGGGDGGGGGGD